MTLFGSRFRRRPRERLTGVVQYFSVAKKMAFIAPHNDLLIIEVNIKVLRRSRLLDLRPGDRVEWEARQGNARRRLYRYRRAGKV
jgi:cold shock CspA family protein